MFVNFERLVMCSKLEQIWYDDGVREQSMKLCMTVVNFNMNFEHSVMC